MADDNKDKAKDEDKPADKPADKPTGDDKSEEESVNMKILEQKEEVRVLEQKLETLETDCNNEIKSFNKNRKDILIQIRKNNYKFRSYDANACQNVDAVPPGNGSMLAARPSSRRTARV